MKKLLILGAMEMHVPLIKRAKELGLYTITCDYIPENPGHKIADEAYFDSTTDLQAVLNLAQRLKIDGIMTYNSDPAAPTVAYVAEKLGLPGNPYSAVKNMSEKDLFRKFLFEYHLNVPRFKTIQSLSDGADAMREYQWPLIIKPVDSSGSKGCTVVYSPCEVPEALNAALERSRCKRAVMEEYIEPDGAQLHGDGFIQDGQLVFLCLGDHHFDASINNLVPYSTTYPTEHSVEHVEKCREQIQKFMTGIGFVNGGFNVELRVSANNKKAYIIDIGARNGGNFTPKVIEYATGFDFMDRAIAVALGENLPEVKWKNNGYYSYLILHSKQDGLIRSISISDEIKKRIVESHMYLHEGQKISSFTGANAAAGVLIMRYENREKMNSIVNDFEKLYSIEVVAE